MKIMQEVTAWQVPYRQPNHVYAMEGDKIYAYSAWGEGKPVYFDRPRTIDRRGRKFIEVPNRWRFRSVKSEQPEGRVWTVTGSKGDIYTVNDNHGTWSCTCPAAKWQKGDCKHIRSLKTVG